MIDGSDDCLSIAMRNHDDSAYVLWICFLTSLLWKKGSQRWDVVVRFIHSCMCINLVKRDGLEKALWE